MQPFVAGVVVIDHRIPNSAVQLAATLDALPSIVDSTVVLSFGKCDERVEEICEKRGVRLFSVWDNCPFRLTLASLSGRGQTRDPWALFLGAGDIPQESGVGWIPDGAADQPSGLLASIRPIAGASRALKPCRLEPRLVRIEGEIGVVPFPPYGLVHTECVRNGRMTISVHSPGAILGQPWSLPPFQLSLDLGLYASHQSFNASVCRRMVGQSVTAQAELKLLLDGLPHGHYLRPAALCEMAMAALDCRSFGEALELARSGLDSYPDYTDLVYIAGRALLGLHRPQEAIAEFTACLVLEDCVEQYHTYPGVGSSLAYEGLGDCHLLLLNWDMCMDAYEVAGEAARDSARVYPLGGFTDVDPAEFREVLDVLELARRSLQIGLGQFPTSSGLLAELRDIEILIGLFRGDGLGRG